jgi:tetratricopeptide (TPR) repeat protein
MGVLPALGLLAALGLAGLWTFRGSFNRRAAIPTATPGPPGHAAATLPVPTLPPPATTLPQIASLPENTGVSPEERDAASRLAAKLNARQPIGSADLALAEGLYARFASEPRLRDLLEVSLVTLAGQEQRVRRFAESAGYLRRAAVVHPDSPTPRIALMNLLLDAGDWSGAEAAARDALSRAPRDPSVLEGLAYALFRQDRNREADEAFRAALEVRDSPASRAYLERIEKNLADERGMTEQRLSHFHVRYDGEEHDEVGREILRALERHYATLTAAFDQPPSGVVTVILFTRQAYYDASGAPAWSGGVFDNTDGRIRIPVMGLTGALTPDMDGTLIHELTHAFIYDLSKGAAPREIHEGLAQYMEGKRIGSELTREQLAALADGRVGGVYGFYYDALAFAEYLIALRGQGGINDLLRAMGDSGDANAAFRQVYGQDFAATRQAFRARFRQQQGS